MVFGGQLFAGCGRVRQLQTVRRGGYYPGRVAGAVRNSFV